MSIHTRVSKELLEGRSAKRLTQKRTANQCGISPRAYLDLENGRALPSLPTALRLSVALGISWDALAQELFGEKRRRYQVFEEQLVSPDGETYCGYGLLCTEKDTPVGRIPDVSCDRTFADVLAQQFTVHQVAPAQFAEAVQDALAFAWRA